MPASQTFVVSASQVEGLHRLSLDGSIAQIKENVNKIFLHLHGKHSHVPSDLSQALGNVIICCSIALQTYEVELNVSDAKVHPHLSDIKIAKNHPPFCVVLLTSGVIMRCLSFSTRAASPSLQKLTVQQIAHWISPFLQGYKLKENQRILLLIFPNTATLEQAVESKARLLPQIRVENTCFQVYGGNVPPCIKMESLRKGDLVIGVVTLDPKGVRKHRAWTVVGTAGIVEEK